MMPFRRTGLPETPAAERRRTARVRLAEALRVRPAFRSTEFFDQVHRTLDASRDGVCFATSLCCYHTGMSVQVTFPYLPVPTPRSVEL